jgi:hypothetical protein
MAISPRPRRSQAERCADRRGQHKAASREAKVRYFYSRRIAQIGLGAPRHILAAGFDLLTTRCPGRADGGKGDLPQELNNRCVRQIAVPSLGLGVVDAVGGAPLRSPRSLPPTLSRPPETPRMVSGLRSCRPTSKHWDTRRTLAARRHSTPLAVADKYYVDLQQIGGRGRYRTADRWCVKPELYH